MVVFLCLVFTAHAETSLKFGGFSHHLITTDHTNYFHRTLMIEHNGFEFGYARNSYDQDIFIAGIYFSNKLKSFTLKTHAGGVYGYSECYGKPIVGKRVLCPIIAPEIEFNLPYRPSVILFGDALVLNFNVWL